MSADKLETFDEIVERMTAGVREPTLELFKRCVSAYRQHARDFAIYFREWGLDISRDASECADG